MKKLFSFFLDKSLLMFLLIGGGNTVLSMAISQFLLKSCGYWGSTAIAFTLCSVLSFVLNRKFSFESKAPLLQSIIRFSVVIAVCYVISFGISDLIVPFLLPKILPSLSDEWITRFAMLFAQVIFTFCNYLGQRLWAFKE